jgi:hypothetical protein
MIARGLRGGRCQCAGCGERFNSMSAFDRHRVGLWRDRGAWRRCLSPEEMLRAGWSLNAAGFWIRSLRRHLPPIGGLRSEPALDKGGPGVIP